MVDNTFLSPGWQQPLELGADIVVHSTTKYLNGHSDVVGGAVIAQDKELHEQLGWWANCLGLTGAPFDSFLTLARAAHAACAPARARPQCAGDRASGSRRSRHVKRVYYPGLPSHPGHEVAKRQQTRLRRHRHARDGGRHDGVRAFVEALSCFSLAESLGGVESLVAHPATMTHAAMAPEARAAAGLVDGLLRLSIGIESIDDLLRDLRERRQIAGLKLTGPSICRECRFQPGSGCT